jgi:hypothetical protein
LPGGAGAARPVEDNVKATKRARLLVVAIGAAALGALVALRARTPGPADPEAAAPASAEAEAEAPRPPEPPRAAQSRRPPPRRLRPSMRRPQPRAAKPRSWRGFASWGFWSGLRPDTEDHLPLLGEIPSVRRLVLATGHFRSGILLAPITGEAIAELLATGSSTVDLAPFSVERFARTAIDPRRGRSSVARPRASRDGG